VHHAEELNFSGDFFHDYRLATIRQVQPWSS